jgi:hypothetical protein
MKVALLLLAILGFSGCAGTFETSGAFDNVGVIYVRPKVSRPYTNYKVVNEPLDEVWKNSVSELETQSFVIDKIDKSSNVISLSYIGEPERYLDCGHINSRVSNNRGERIYNFQGVKANQIYEVMSAGDLFKINRTMFLEAHVSLVFEEVTQNKTKVTANAHYNVKKAITSTYVGDNTTKSYSEDISFDSGGSASFPRSTTCLANGALEREILSAIQ